MSVLVYSLASAQGGPPPQPFWDFGDAPSSYGLASHFMSPGPLLGSSMDYEAAPSLFSDEADGDDNDNIDDEDGIEEDQLVGLSTTSENFSVDVSFINEFDIDATVYGWIDFDISGTFDSDEFTSSSVAKHTSGKTTLNWNDLAGRIDIIDGKTYARFRITQGDLSSDDSATEVDNGEVEDYVLIIGNNVLGVDDEILSNSLNIYPNPVAGILNIESKLELKGIVVYDLLGQEVKLIENGFKSINLSELSKGIYMIKIHSENGSTVRKLIKQ